MSRKRHLGLLHFLVLAIFLVGLLTVLIPTSMVRADDPVVTFPDPGLEAAIRDAIGIPSGDILQSDLDRLTKLASGPFIMDLTGLEHCTSLTWLDLVCSCQLSDISPLAGLTNLTYLDLNQDGSISDFSPLAGLTNLTYLNLRQTGPTDISFLTDLTRLTHLSLYMNVQIEDFSVLSGLGNLTYLDVSFTCIDLSVLSGLTSLTSLDLCHSFTHVDLSFLSGLTSLTHLNLSDNGISDISPLAGLTSLTYLNLSLWNQISDIQPLVNNPGLASGDTVGLWGNPLNDDSINTYIPTLLGRGVTVDWQTPNQAPNQPSNISPANGATGVTLTPTLESTAFFDPEGDAHVASEWQVTTTPGDYYTPVFDLPGTAYLTSFPVPSWTLAHSTTYYWRVRHLGDHGPWSEWSSETSFTTASAQVETATGTGPAAFDASSGTIENLTAVADSSLPSGGKPDIQFPHGLFQFNITGLTSGQSVTITIALPSAVPGDAQYWKYGPTLSDSTPHWYQIPWTRNSRNPISITLTDGGVGDDDLAANGTIIDQGGPAWVPSPVVTFADPQLEAAIRDAIGIPTGEVYQSDLNGLAALDAQGRGITDLTGLEHCTSLTYLNLWFNQITDSSPISGLTSLTYLNLGLNGIGDISPLSGLTSLTHLNLSYNYRLEDLTPLSGLGNLTYLDVSAIEPLDSGTFSPLSGLTNLTYLDMIDCRVHDISFVSSLTKLTHLNLWWTTAKDLSPLSGLTNLTYLELALSFNESDDNLTPLSGLTNLTYLGLEGRAITDVSPLCSLTSLTSLNLNGSRITDVSPLSGLTSLTHLELSGNRISDLIPLSGLTSLTELGLGNNQISDLEPLVNNLGLSSGDTLDLWRNPLNDTSINTYIPTLLGKGVTVHWDTANQAPNQPGNISPADAAIDVSLTPTLESSTFSDPDADTHAASEWQITTMPGDYSTPVFDLPGDSCLASCPVPTWTLAHSTTYYWRVRYLGSNGPWSEWSPETSFTTCAPTPVVTPVGEGDQPVTVTGYGVATTFDNVTLAGDTTYTLYEDNPVVGSTPPGFGVLGLFVEIATTATYDGPITIGISYDPATPNPEDLRLFHWNGTGWYDVTKLPVDTERSIIYGVVDSLSPFFVGQPTSLPPANLPPVVTAGGDAETNEGATFTGSGSFTDPDGSSWTATVDYGDGSGVQALTLTGNSFDLSRVYADDGTYTVTVTVTDDDGSVGSDTLTVTVNNVAPTVEAGADQTAQVFNQVSFAGNFSDPGWLDTHTITWNFGDGSLEAVGTLTPTHTYSLVGTYKVTLTVDDNDGGVTTDTLNVEVIQKYAIWANSSDGKAIQWSGSGAQITGKVHSNGGITMSGSKNAINGTVYYISKFAITGSSDHCTASQQLSSPKPMPVHYDLSAYQPGGTAAQAAGKYQCINGNFSVSKSGAVLDGLYYVKGNVSLSGSNIKGTFTIVAEGTISISGSGMNGTAYSGDLLFFSNGASLNISGSNSTLGGIIYVPNGQINISGSNNTINGSLFGDRFALSGSNTKITVR